MKQEKALDAIRMTRAIREELSKLYYENPEEYFRQINESGRKLLARRKRLSKKLNTNSDRSVSKGKENYASR